MPDTIQTITGYIALAVPITLAIANLTKLALEWLQHRHTLTTSKIDQAHQITTHYLNKALDPTVPLAIRHQLLRFLATPDEKGLRLSNWAKSELGRIEVIIDASDKAVEAAEKELLAAKTHIEIAAAERKLAVATSKRSSLLEPPKAPQVSPAALKAGLIEDKSLAGLVFRNCDLKGMRLEYGDLSRSDFSGSDITSGRFQGTDLRGVDFTNANLSEACFYGADLRGAILKGANLKDADFQKARLESADLSGAILGDGPMPVTYDEHTKWPEGYDAAAHGAVYMS